MDASDKKQLEKAGYQVGSAFDFFGLSDEEAAFIDMKIALVGLVYRSRRARELTRENLAIRIGSSQSCVARMEKGDPSVSIDLILRAALAAGATREQIGQVMARGFDADVVQRALLVKVDNAPAPDMDAIESNTQDPNDDLFEEIGRKYEKVLKNRIG